MAFGLAVVLGFALAGEAISAVLPFPVPGSVLGMVLLALALRLRVVSADSVRDAAEALTKRMSLFFVPAGVGVVAQAEVLRKDGLAIGVAAVVSMVLVLAVVGKLADRSEAA